MNSDSDFNSPSPQQQNITLWIVWGALTASIIVYLVVLQMSGPESDSNKGENDSLVTIFSIVAVANLVISFGVRFLYTRKVAAQAPSENDPKRYQRLFASCIVSWALAEAVAIYGLVLGLGGSSFSTTSGFFIVGFTAMVALAPTFARLNFKLTNG